MFTGLVEHQAEVMANNRGDLANRLIIQSPFSSVQPGESIAVNGVCLTLLPGTDEGLAFDVSPETLMLTTSGLLQPGDKVNLERSMLASSRFGGHYVTGHVDAVACVRAVRVHGDYIEMSVGDFQQEAMSFLPSKGSITLDGVSLTINTADENGITLMLVPYTLAHTTLSGKKAGQPLNVEFDYFTRIVAHQLRISGQLKDEMKL